ncbi:MAG TPA: hypothetical protein H9759_10245 [Candidatus Dietzia intestinipullorum]|nr:hypothetical protein [Candidatus Dietzia intestinipullorum]
MAPRQTARRLLIAVPAVALTALATAACSPPNEQPADADAPYTLPTYSEENEATSTQETTSPEGAADESEGEQVDEGMPGEGEGMPGAEGAVPGAEAPVEGAAPGGPAPAEGQAPAGAGMDTPPAPAQ